MPKLLFKLT